MVDSEYILCPVCEVDDTTLFIPFGSRDIVRCRHCGLVYVNPRRSQREVRKFFKERYISDVRLLDREFGTWRDHTLRREAALIKNLKRPGKILDVGCAGGEFLAYFLSDGWDCHGVEPSMLAAKSAAKRGIRVYNGVLKDVDFAESAFDVVTHLDTLYFSPTPREDLAKLNLLLKADGLLIIELPGLAYRTLRNVGPASLLINRRWCHFSSLSPHLYYFSTASLSRLLQKVGFEISSVRLEQAPRRGNALMQFVNDAYFYLTSMVFGLTRGRVNLATKVVYVCRKTC